MNSLNSVLSFALEDCDLVTVSVVGSSERCRLLAKVEHIYSCRHGISQAHLGTEIEFIRAPSTWGNTGLKTGERALLFVGYSSNSESLYEHPWRGHMVIKEIDGELSAIIDFAELWLDEDLPPSVRSAARQNPLRKDSSIVRFDALEAYLKDRVEQYGRIWPLAVVPPVDEKPQ